MVIQIRDGNFLCCDLIDFMLTREERIFIVRAYFETHSNYARAHEVSVGKSEGFSL